MNQTAAAPSGGYKWYALGVLMLVALFNYIDRQALSILQVPIKQELGLSDTQLGALTGLAFAFLYSTLAIPIARLADRKSRKRVLCGALVVWSLMTAGCGLATGFLMLAVMRMGVAVGEAGAVPATHAMLADFFPREQRATAIAIWTLAIPFGTMLGFAAGGWLSEAMGWRQAFLVLGGIGVALAPFVFFALREPQRGATDLQPTAAEVPPLREAVLTLWRLRAFRYSACAGGLMSYALYATLNWNAPFYSRVFGLPLGQLAGYLALLAGIGGGLGIYLGGVMADRLGKRDARWYLGVPACAAFAAAPCILLQYFAGDSRLSLGFGFMTALLVNSYMPPVVATSQTLVPAGLRAFTSATLVLIVNLIGLGLGPLVTGMLSDWLAPQLGNEALRYAIASSSLAALLAAWLFQRAAVHLPAELPTGAASAAQAKPRADGARLRSA